MYWIALIILIPYLYLILKIYSGLKKVTVFQKIPASNIPVSVVVACHNEEKRISFLLSDIAIQDYDHLMIEVIVVDDNSTDSTYKIVSDFEGIRNLKVIRNSGQGKKSAIRKGIDESSGVLVITTDADCRAGKSWISTISSFYEFTKSELIICPVLLEQGNGFLNRFQQLEFLSLQGVTAGTTAIEDPIMCNGANLAFPKEIYQKHSGDLHDKLASGEDVFLLHNIKHVKGTKIRWLESDEALVTTKAAESLRSFLSQRARWISKAGYYTDKNTRLTAISAFAAVCLQASAMLAGFFSLRFFALFVAVFVLKSIPDMLILSRVVRRYKKRNLLKWFLPSQFLYPFYVLYAALLSFSYRERW